MNLIELSNNIRNEDDAVRFLQQKGLLHNPRHCRNGHDMILQLGNRQRWSCGKRACQQYIHIRKGTWFEGSRLPFRSIIMFIYSWIYQYATEKYCEKELKINHGTRVDWANYLREACAAELLGNPIRIGGAGLTVELDESLISR